MQQTMQAQQLRRMAERSAVAFLLSVLCVYPLYIDKFSNLGVVKFTGVATLSWAFCLWLGALAAIGGAPPCGSPALAHRPWPLGAGGCGGHGRGLYRYLAVARYVPVGGWAATTAAA